MKSSQCCSSKLMSGALTVVRLRTGTHTTPQSHSPRPGVIAYNAAVERRRAALSSAQQAHNEMARLLRARDDGSPSAPTAC